MTTARYSARQAATRLGISAATVLRAAERAGVGLWIEQPGKGRTVRLLFLTAAELPAVLAAVKPVGNPNFKPGNYFGRPRKISRNRKK